MSVYLSVVIIWFLTSVYLVFCFTFPLCLNSKSRASICGFKIRNCTLDKPNLYCTVKMFWLKNFKTYTNTWHHFFTFYQYAGKTDLTKGYLNPKTKLVVTTHFSVMIIFGSNLEKYPYISMYFNAFLNYCCSIILEKCVVTRFQ